MTEATQVYSAVRANLKPFGVIRRCEHKFDLGWPDVYYCIRGSSGWLELKLIPESGRCPKHFTQEQLIFGEEEIAAGGRWYLLGRRGKEWLLLNAAQARAWFEGRGLTAVVQVTGKFPLKEILKELVK